MSEAYDWKGDALKAIADLHVKGVGASGMSDGVCVECDHPWPCPTYHLAAGWGDGRGCATERWCEHIAAVLV